MPLPDPLKSYRLYVAMFLLNLAVVLGVIYLIRRDPPRPILVTQPPARPATTTKKIAPSLSVTVGGAVNHPGTIQLDDPARLADALQKTGLQGDADVSALDLTRALKDGDTINVPTRASNPPAVNNLTATTPSTANTPIPAVTIKTNLNTATTAELDALPGIGPALAQRILDYRAQIGGFTSIEQLIDVRGIGDTLFNDLKELITVQ